MSAALMKRPRKIRSYVNYTITCYRFVTFSRDKLLWISLVPMIKIER